MAADMADPNLSQIVAAMTAVFQRKGLAVPRLDAGTPLDGSLGLDSLDFAEVVVRLEAVFGFDPFAERSVENLRTVGDLAALYRR
jgi:acyl carrier protein